MWATHISVNQTARVSEFTHTHMTMHTLVVYICRQQNACCLIGYSTSTSASTSTTNARILFRLHIDSTIICTGVCAGTTNGKLLASHMLFDVVCVRLADITPVSLHGKFMRVQNMRVEKCARVRSFFIRPNTSANFRFTFDLSHSLIAVHRTVYLFLLLPSSSCHSNLRSAFRSILYTFPCRTSLIGYGIVWRLAHFHHPSESTSVKCIQ